MLLERLARREESSTTQTDSKIESGTPDKGSVRILPPSNENHMKQGELPVRRSRQKSCAYHLETEPGGIDWFRESLPLELNVIRGAIVMGNRSTPSLVVAGFRSAVGTCGAVQVGSIVYESDTLANADSINSRGRHSTFTSRSTNSPLPIRGYFSAKIMTMRSLC